jgi:hypothetical protein
MVLGHPSEKSQYYEPLHLKNFHDYFSICWTIFLSRDFSELGIRIFFENGLGSFQTFLILQILEKPEVLKRFQKQF